METSPKEGTRPRLVSIVYKPQEGISPEDGYYRVPLQQANLLAGQGIEGDGKGGGRRHLNIMSAQTLEELAREGFCTSAGQMGEQILVAGLDVDALPLGTRLLIGEQACVELSEARTGCAKFERYQGKGREEAAGRLGMIACVLASGEIRVGDPVCVLHETVHER